MNNIIHFRRVANLTQRGNVKYQSVKPNFCDGSWPLQFSCKDFCGHVWLNIYSCHRLGFINNKYNKHAYNKISQQSIIMDPNPWLPVHFSSDTCDLVTEPSQWYVHAFLSAHPLHQIVHLTPRLPGHRGGYAFGVPPRVWMQDLETQKHHQIVYQTPRLPGYQGGCVFVNACSGVNAESRRTS